MEKTKKEKKILDAVGETKTTQFHRLRHTKKLMGLPVGTLALYVSAFLVGAVLISAFFTTYYATMTGDVEVNGIAQPPGPLTFDTTNLLTETTSLPMDITDLTAGDSESYTHTLASTNGQWDVTFVSNNQYTDPLDEFFGFSFDITDMSDDSILDEGLVLTDEGQKQCKFVYALDPLFLLTPNALPFDLALTFSAHTNLNPIASDDVGNMVETTTGMFANMQVLSNDIDPEGHGLTILTAVFVSGTPDWHFSGVGGTYPNQYLIIQKGAGTQGVFDYTISDMHGGTDIGRITIAG